MHILGASRPALSPASATRRGTSERHDPETAETGGRALVAVGATVASERFSTLRHPAASFLAHLIATQMQAPQTRARRRADPEEAMAVYGAIMAARPVTCGRVFGKRA